MWFKKKPKILIVEDRKDNHELFRTAFEAVDFEVMVCQSAEDNFIDEVVSFEPDIISMDLMIGSQSREITRDGFAAMELLQSDERTRHIPVIVLTSFFSDEKVERAEQCGAIDFLNLQGQSLPNIAQQFRSYIDNPKKYQPSHPLFQDR